MQEVHQRGKKRKRKGNKETKYSKPTKTNDHERNTALVFQSQNGGDRGYRWGFGIWDCGRQPWRTFLRSRTAVGLVPVKCTYNVSG